MQNSTSSNIHKLWDKIRRSTSSNESEAFYSHIFSCPDCHGVSGKYCADGARLRADLSVLGEALDVVFAGGREDRRRRLAQVDDDIKADVEAKVREVWDEITEEAQACTQKNGVAS